MPPIVPVPLTQPLVSRPREHPRQPVQRHRFRRRSSARERSVHGRARTADPARAASRRAERRHRRSARAWPAQPRASCAPAATEPTRRAWYVAALDGRRRRHLAGNRPRQARARSRVPAGRRTERGRSADDAVNSEAAMALKMTRLFGGEPPRAAENTDFDAPTTQVRMGITLAGRLRPADDDVGHGAAAHREQRGAPRRRSCC